ncbi:mycothiol synthase [Virgisporangium aurantiacum]|uniref:Mycothiol acetyltransferase n=1 Tax=Virgisporangium aurantiacum TaxID=175570 RepID=A0A8J4DXC6_9ACTN|nr:mycothiol synthase [Virgisporangium aurantiacum]GIJ53784.1 mycothiol acetyltransferase [Virgisporangium aurantiacum]
MEVTHADRLTPDQLTAVAELTAEAEAVDGTPPLSEQTVLRLALPGVHLLLNGGRDGYAHLDHDGAAELIIAPHRRGHGLGRALVRAAVAAADPAGGRLEVWSHGDHPAAAALAREFGFARTRVLHRLRRPLSAAFPPVELPDGVSIRTFVPGDDDEAWLRVNARAFATHPEQGRMTLADLRQRMAEPWFDPSGFLLAVRGSTILGFHWTKIHPDGLGEIYVLGVDPSAADLRLGRPLAIAGLVSLRDRGVETAMLYVDESNPRAMRLYDKLGFTPWSSDVTYLRTGGASG